MKKFFLCLVLTVVLITIPVLTLANNGAMAIPHLAWFSADSSNYQLPYIYVSNQTNGQITVEVTFFKMDGTILKSCFATDSISVLNFSTDISDASFSFNLNAYCTGRVNLNIPFGTPLNYGYGRIVWSNTDLNTTHGVIAHITNSCKFNGVNSISENLINNGLPF
jgi:hypothetical protein